jgi:DNA-binding response OmpR family regulator
MKKILVVEDDRAVQKALLHLFEAENFVVEVTPDGEAGLQAFRSFSTIRSRSGSPVAGNIRRRRVP